MKKQILNIVALLTIFSLALAACGTQPTATPAPAESVVSSNEVVAEGRLEPIQGTNLSFQTRGVVEAILVQAGDSVKKGDVLARLTNAGVAEAQVVIAQNAYDTLLRNESGDRARLWQAYMDAQTKRGEAEQKWDDLNVDNIEDNIEDDKATVEDRREDLQDAQDDFEKYKDLDEDNSNRKSAEDDLERAQEDLNQAIRNLEDNIRERDEVRARYDAALAVEAEAKYQYEISLDGPNADQLTLAKANLDSSQDTLSNYVLTAPFDGIVADVSVKAGEQVTVETRVISIANFDSWVIETTDITELEVVKLSVGQPVLFVPDALPDVSLKGTITEISQAFTQQGGDILYTVRIAVQEADPRLKWGMTVEVTFMEPVQQ
ncbi:HlyD family efflux transporter periplasmic adaptor subunit [Candidatus Villigracilis affinis]|uniref:HlyD family secretion protein n=1 Tax=Candidatus Villigracilis affinis TaxID=3140682 RepID=UPI002A20242D|nr:HlyD family efflux transporter periplasmic adaptor subunit [Anaerolineales bacterium]